MKGDKIRARGKPTPASIYELLASWTKNKSSPTIKIKIARVSRSLR